MIESGLSRGRNANAIWQDLVTDHGFAHGYESVKRFVHKLRGSSSPSARAVIFTAPGEEAQVDYGNGPMVRDPQNRRVHHKDGQDLCCDEIGTNRHFPS
jgi:hypothetical protein